MESLAYSARPPEVPTWLNTGDNAWQLTAATLIGIESMPGLVILYGSIVKKKWAINSAFMALYAFASTYIVWVLLADRMAFGEKLLPFWGKGRPVIGSRLLLRARVTATVKFASNGTVESPMVQPFFPTATLVHFHFTYAALTVVLLGGSVLGRMNIKAWMVFVPLWVIFSYTVGAFSLWGGGFLYQWGVLDYSGGYVIHVSSGIAGFVAAYWVGPRIKGDKERFSPNNILLTLAGAGFLWMGWTGFNGGAPLSPTIATSVAVLNTNLSASTSLLTWMCLDVIFFGKPSVIGAIQGMITGLVCITPAAGLVQGWAAFVIGLFGGSVPWFSMMILHKKSALLQLVDDTLAVFHTHAVAGILGGLLVGLFAEPKLCAMETWVPDSRGVVYGGDIMLLMKQLAGALFVVAWNIIATSAILLVVKYFTPLRMSDEQLLVGDDAAHGEEAYALWGDGEKYDATRVETLHTKEAMHAMPSAARGTTVQV